MHETKMSGTRPPPIPEQKEERVLAAAVVELRRLGGFDRANSLLVEGTLNPALVGLPRGYSLSPSAVKLFFAEMSFCGKICPVLQAGLQWTRRPFAAALA